ncbi:MAG TPA: SigB/SigF/SigG family RNA polymerase sigma factor [Thermoleophilaceae bacterium]
MSVAGPIEARAYEASNDPELLERYHQAGDIRARQLLIERHMPLVRRLAQRYAQRGEALEDLTQVGCVGLIKAIDRFDGEYQVALASYATPNILGEIKRHFRDKGWAMRVPREVQELNVRLGPVMDQLTVQLGRSPTVDELAAVTRAPRERVVEALESSRAYSALSLSAPSGGDDEGSTAMDALGTDEAGYGRSEDRQLLRQGLETLPERERAILHMRFFQGLTQSEIAARVGISQMHVSRLIRQSVERVRDVLDGPGRSMRRRREPA